ELLRLGERDHRLGERGSESFCHVAQQVGVPHLKPGLGPAHPPAVATCEHQQRGLHMLIIFLPMKAIDFTVHLPTPEWLDVSMKGYVEAAESYFRSKVAKRSLEELARDYEKLDVLALLLAWD